MEPTDESNSQIEHSFDESHSNWYTRDDLRREFLDESKKLYYPVINAYVAAIPGVELCSSGLYVDYVMVVTFFSPMRTENPILPLSDRWGGSSAVPGILQLQIITDLLVDSHTNLRDLHKNITELVNIFRRPDIPFSKLAKKFSFHFRTCTRSNPIPKFFKWAPSYDLYLEEPYPHRSGDQETSRYHLFEYEHNQQEHMDVDLWLDRWELSLPERKLPGDEQVMVDGWE
ncbi:hypothetical protein F4779DRAFT_568880 [Xylariaceae sp. FL0662B]|nr:hypothetical protein F4779DRAFT_568880 [Xylariaceae sp. FL0662B]